MEIDVISPGHDEGKLHRLLEGPIQAFPGNASLAQFFQVGFAESRIKPEVVALIEGERHYTFRELNELSSKLAETIRDQLRLSTSKANHDGDTIVGVCIHPSDKLILALFAIIKLGAAYLPFDVTFPEERVIQIIKESRPSVIISDSQQNILSKFEAVKDLTRVVSIADLLNAIEAKNFSEEDLNRVEPVGGLPNLAERTAIVLYTSGSSGLPKGVRLSHRNILNRLHWQWQTFPYKVVEKCVFKTSLTFVDSVAEIFGPLLQGHSITILNKTTISNPNLFMQKLYKYEITRLVLVPSLLKAMFSMMKIVGEEGGRRMLSSVKLWICSGETFSKDLLIEFFEHFPHGHTICNLYGSTEVMADVSYVSYSNRQEVYQKSLEYHVPLGQAINNTVIYVLDPELEMVQMEESGEIYIAGYNLAKGYVAMPDHPSFIANPYSKTTGFNRLYKTGDFGRITETQGKVKTLAYEGRLDSQIKVRGQKVDLSEIEFNICAIDLIAKAKVLCYHPGKDDQTIVAFIVPKHDDHIDRVKSLIDSKLRDYERPVLRVIEDIPLLVNGKTDRQRLLKIYEQEMEQTSDFVDWNALEIPDSKFEIAKIVIITIAEVVGTSVEIVAEDLENSFYNVGGSSLNSVEVIVKLREKNHQISIQDFTSAKSIKQIIYSTVFDETKEEANNWVVAKDAGSKYKVSMLVDGDKEDASHIIAHSFAEHGDLEAYTRATYDDFKRLINSIWEILVEKGFSFIVRRADDSSAVAVALNFDVYDEPTQIEASQGIAYVFEMLGKLEFLESRQREKLPKGKGKLVHSFMMGTSEKVDESENVYIIEFMEEEILRIAKEKNYKGIMTTNTNPLTQQIGISLHGYEVLSEYQVNKYIAPDGTKPFILAPDKFKIICCWKRIQNGPKALDFNSDED